MPHFMMDGDAKSGEGIVCAWDPEEVDWITISCGNKPARTFAMIQLPAGGGTVVLEQCSGTVEFSVLVDESGDALDVAYQIAAEDGD